MPSPSPRTCRSDAHAKNVSFLVDHRGITLAPPYDLLSVAVYGVDFDYMAMTIAEEVRYGWVEAEHWTRLAREIGISPSFVHRLTRQLARSLPGLARKVLEDPSFIDEERVFLERVCQLIEMHAGYLL